MIILSSTLLLDQFEKDFKVGFLLLFFSSFILSSLDYVDKLSILAVKLFQVDNSI